MNNIIYYFLFIILCSFSFSNKTLKDQVELVVGDNIVLKGDIDFELNFYKSQNNLEYQIL